MCTEKNNFMYYYLLYTRNIGMVKDSSWEKINGIKKREKIVCVDLKTT